MCVAGKIQTACCSAAFRPPPLPLPPFSLALSSVLVCPSVQAISTAHRMLSTPADEINADMAQFGIGELPLHSTAEQKPLQVGPGSDSYSRAPAPASSSGLAETPHHIVADMQEANRELFSFFGAPPMQPDAAARGAAEGISQHLAAQIGQAAQVCSGGGPAGFSAQRGDHQEAASGSLQNKAGAADVSHGDGHHLTHVDASGKAAMVDVSHVSSRCITQPACHACWQPFQQPALL